MAFWGDMIGDDHFWSIDFLILLLLNTGADDLSEQTFNPTISIFYKFIILYDHNRQMSSHAPTDVFSQDKSRLTHRQMSSHTETDRYF